MVKRARNVFSFKLYHVELLLSKKKVKRKYVILLFIGTTDVQPNIIINNESTEGIVKGAFYLYVVCS